MPVPAWVYKVRNLLAQDVLYCPLSNAIILDLNAYLRTKGIYEPICIDLQFILTTTTRRSNNDSWIETIPHSKEDSWECLKEIGAVIKNDAKLLWIVSGFITGQTTNEGFKKIEGFSIDYSYLNQEFHATNYELDQQQDQLGNLSAPNKLEMDQLDEKRLMAINQEVGQHHEPTSFQQPSPISFNHSQQLDGQIQVNPDDNLDFSSEEYKKTTQMVEPKAYEEISEPFPLMKIANYLQKEFADPVSSGKNIDQTFQMESLEQNDNKETHNNHRVEKNENLSGDNFFDNDKRNSAGQKGNSHNVSKKEEKLTKLNQENENYKESNSFTPRKK